MGVLRGVGEGRETGARSGDVEGAVGPCPLRTVEARGDGHRDGPVHHSCRRAGETAFPPSPLQVGAVAFCLPPLSAWSVPLRPSEGPGLQSLWSRCHSEHSEGNATPSMPGGHSLVLPRKRKSRQHPPNIIVGNQYLQKKIPKRFINSTILSERS